MAFSHATVLTKAVFLHCFAILCTEILGRHRYNSEIIGPHTKMPPLLAPYHRFPTFCPSFGPSRCRNGLVRTFCPSAPCGPHFPARLMRRYYIGRDVQGTIVCKQVSFEEGCEMTAFAEKVRDAEPLFQRLPAFPDLTITVRPPCPLSLTTFPVSVSGTCTGLS